MIIPAWYLDETRYKYSYEDIRGVLEEPKKGLKSYGPYSKNKFRDIPIGIAILCPQVHRVLGERFYTAFQNGLLNYRPFANTYQLSCHSHPAKFTELGKDASAYRSATLELVQSLDRTKAKLWLCFLIVEDGFKQLPIQENPYFASRAILLSHQIIVQSVTVEKLAKADQDLQWILDSIAVQSYAKLGGTPWTIATEQSEPEIIIGIGEARTPKAKDGDRIFGFATVFTQNGAYLWTRFGQPVVGFDRYVESLQSKVKQSIEHYTQTEKVAPKRLIIHLHKPPGKMTEARAIENALTELETNIECAFVHIDHTTDFRVFETGSIQFKPQGRLATYIDEYQRLVVLSGKEIPWIPPRAAILRLSPRSTYRDVNALTQQVYNFTKVNYAGFQPNNVPVTIKYAAQLAQKYASLDQLDGDWYRLITEGFLLDKVWFL